MKEILDIASVIIGYMFMAAIGIYSIGFAIAGIAEWNDKRKHYAFEDVWRAAVKASDYLGSAYPALRETLRWVLDHQYKEKHILPIEQFRHDIKKVYAPMYEGVSIGDTLQLCTGGCLMTVDNIIHDKKRPFLVEYDTFECVWFDDLGNNHRDTFTAQQLRKVYIGKPLTAPTLIFNN